MVSRGSLRVATAPGPPGRHPQPRRDELTARTHPIGPPRQLATLGSLRPHTPALRRRRVRLASSCASRKLRTPGRRAAPRRQLVGHSFGRISIHGSSPGQRPGDGPRQTAHRLRLTAFGTRPVPTRQSHHERHPTRGRPQARAGRRTGHGRRATVRRAADSLRQVGDRRRPPTDVRRLSSVGCLPWTVGRCLSAVSCRLSAVCRSPSTVGCLPWAVGRFPWAVPVDCLPSSVARRPWAVVRGLSPWTVGRFPWTVGRFPWAVCRSPLVAVVRLP